MLKVTLGALIFSVFFVSCNADCYMHNPRGSNNRLNEKSANRGNANRLFDSQNNNRGGYNVGDKTDKAAGNNAASQYQMEYFMSGTNANDVTKLAMEWTNQHGCGGNEDNNPNKLNCDLIIQYTTEPVGSETNKKFQMRDGTSTSTQNYQNINGESNKNGVRKFTETKNQYTSRKNNNVRNDRGYQEPHEWYDKCRARYRNKGLFKADQNVKDDRATHTRQNPYGNRRGYECPEERDYFPYWHPTMWRDVMVYTKNKSRCEFYKTESFNVKPRGECVEKWPNSNEHRHYSSADTSEKCKELNGEWVDFHNYLEIANIPEADCAGPKYEWAVPYRHAAADRKKKACLVKLSPPDCDEAPFSRTNHLGNGADLKPLRHQWSFPHFPSGKDTKFILRIRYNISTDDYDPHKTDSKSNDKQGGPRSPVTQNPFVDVGAGQTLRLAINTAQFGRTFQDRTHVSYFKKRPTEVTGVVHNLNVRGKRGNIVQTFPAVEYDFIPRNLQISKNDMVHIQWTGSNTHNNGNPAGDGQAGDAGRGTGGTDRNNIAGLGQRNDNFPSVMEDKSNLCHHLSVIWERNKAFTTNKKHEWYDVCLKLGSAGYYDCKSGCTNALDTKAKMEETLNNAPASFAGMVVKFKGAGEHHYMCTRNNQFTNRSQKGSIIVSEK